MREKEARRCFPISPPLPISPQPSQNPPCPPLPKATFLKSPLTKAFFNHILSARLKSFKQLFFQPLTPLHYHHPITLSPPSRRLWMSHSLQAASHDGTAQCTTLPPPLHKLDSPQLSLDPECKHRGTVCVLNCNFIFSLSFEADKCSCISLAVYSATDFEITPIFHHQTFWCKVMLMVIG